MWKLLTLPLKLAYYILALAVIVASAAFISKVGLSTYDMLVSSYVQSNVTQVGNRQNFGGTAFLARYNGKKYLVTNKHVCEHNENGHMLVKTPDGMKWKKVLAASKNADVCLLEPIDGSGLFLTPNVAKNQPVIMHGHGFGENLSARDGRIVETVVKQMNLFPITGDQDMEKCAELDGNISIMMFFIMICQKTQTVVETTVQGGPGSSGSPVVDMFGRVVGVMSLFDTRNLRVFLVKTDDLIILINKYEEKQNGKTN